MPSKTISFSLDAGSVERAIREVERYAEELRSKMGELIQRLVDDGKNIAKAQIVQYDAIFTSSLLSSIDGYYNEDTRTGFIVAGAPHAIFVEYGTGIVGAGSSHPEMDGMWAPPPGEYTKYDTNEHGSAGWWYPALHGWYIPKHGDGSVKLAWTSGMRSRPFMYGTFKQLERLSVDIYNELFSK